MHSPCAISNRLPELDDEAVDGPPHNPDEFKRFVPSGKGGLPSDIAKTIQGDLTFKDSGLYRPSKKVGGAMRFSHDDEDNAFIIDKECTILESIQNSIIISRGYVYQLFIWNIENGLWYFGMT